MKKLISFIILLSLFSCGNKSGKKNETPTSGQATIVAVWTRPDSTKQLDIMLRVISKTVKYDSVLKKDIVAIDTAWGRPIYITLVDSLGKKVLDKNGKEQTNPQPQYVLVPKDSVNTHVENIPIDSLLKKK